MPGSSPTRRGSILVGIALACCAAPAATAPALAQTPPGTDASPGELWRAYPLKPKAGSLESKLDHARSLERPAAAAPPATAPAATRPPAGDDGPPAGLIAGGLGAAFMAGVAVTLVARRRRTGLAAAPAEASAPAPATVAAEPITARDLRAGDEEAAGSFARPAEARAAAVQHGGNGAGGAAATSVAERLTVPPWKLAWPEETHGRWRAEIVWDRGWAWARYRALALGPGRFNRPQLVSESEEFKWVERDDPVRSDDKHREAVEALSARMTEAGWEPIDAGASWWSHRFVWPGDAPPAVARSRPRG